MVDYSLRLSDQEIARYRFMAEAARTSEAGLWELAGIVPGAVVADVGCGPGAMLPALSEAVGPTGSVEGIDGDEQAVVAATALVDSAGLSNVRVRQGKADHTELGTARFDAVMIRHVLAHNGVGAQAIVRHLAALLKPGGCALLVDIDATAVRIRPDDPVVAELGERYRAFQTARGGDMQIGLRLDHLLGGAGLELVAYRGLADVLTVPPGVRPPAWAARAAMVEAGFATEEDVVRWGMTFDELEASGVPFTIFAPRYLAIGRRVA